MPILSPRCVDERTQGLPGLPHTQRKHTLRHSVLPFTQASNLVVMESSWRNQGNLRRCGPHLVEKLGQEDEEPFQIPAFVVSIVFD